MKVGGGAREPHLAGVSGVRECVSCAAPHLVARAFGLWIRLPPGLWIGMLSVAWVWALAGVVGDGLVSIGTHNNPGICFQSARVLVGCPCWTQRRFRCPCWSGSGLRAWPEYRCLAARPELELCFGARAWYWPLALGLARLPLGRLVALKCSGLGPELPIGWLRSLAVQVRWPSWPGRVLKGAAGSGGA